VQRSDVEVVDETLGGLAPDLPLVLVGPAGSGRSVLCLQLAAAALARGDRVVLLCGEPPRLLLGQAESLGIDLGVALRNESLALLEMADEAASLLRSTGPHALIEAIEAEAPRASLWLIDPLTMLTADMLDEAELRRCVRTLFEHGSLAQRTTVVTVASERLDTNPQLERVLKEICGAYACLSHTADGERSFSVVKSRAAEHSDTLHFEIGPGGTHPVAAPDPSADAPTHAPVTRKATAASAAAPAQSHPGQGSLSARKRPRILVIEDERLMRTMLEDWLSERYEVLTAADGFEGVTRALADPPDLITLDLEMPRADGFDVLRALRRSGARRPVLVISGKIVRAVDRLRLLVLGATDLMTKPARRFEVLQKVETLLQLPVADVEVEDTVVIDELLGQQAAMEVLDEDAFSERVELVQRFGEEYGLPSTVVAIEARDDETLDALLEQARHVLRSEDAALRLSKRRALLLLCATDVATTPMVLRRLGARLETAGGSALTLRWKGSELAPRFEDGSWKDHFDGLGAWPDPRSDTAARPMKPAEAPAG